MFTAFEDPREKIDMPKIGYACWQEEVCPKTGKHHWQGYCELPSKTTRGEFQKRLGCGNVHCEIPRHLEEARAYTFKEESRVPDSFTEVGTRFVSQQGHRSDLDSLYDCIEAGMPKWQIAVEHRGHALRFAGHIERVQKWLFKPDSVDMMLMRCRFGKPMNDNEGELFKARMFDIGEHRRRTQGGPNANSVPEVAGNTVSATSEEIEQTLESVYGVATTRKRGRGVAPPPTRPDPVGRVGPPTRPLHYRKAEPAFAGASADSAEDDES